MKRQSKKGFTLVELVIVIAVIAILSAILIPTFSNVVQNANRTSAQAELKSLITTYISEGEAADAETRLANVTDKVLAYEGRIFFYDGSEVKYVADSSDISDTGFSATYNSTNYVYSSVADPVVGTNGLKITVESGDFFYVLAKAAAQSS